MAHILLICQFTALRTEKGDITTGRAAVYRRFACITCNVGSALLPSSSCSSFRSWLPGDSTKLSACPPGGPYLRLFPLTNLVLPVIRSSCHPDAPSGEDCICLLPAASQAPDTAPQSLRRTLCGREAKHTHHQGSTSEVPCSEK